MYLKQRLLTEDVGFFLQQLRREPVQLLLLNGRSVSMEFEHAFGQRLEPRHPDVVSERVRGRFFTGRVDGVRVVGWSTNLQSSFGVSNELRRQIGERVAELGRGSDG